MFERDFGESAFDDEPEAIERLCQEALALFEDGELGAAKERAMEAVAMDDEHPFPMFVLGLVAEFEGDIPSARDLSDLALTTASTNADAIQLRAQVHVREHQFEEAESLLRFGILHNPDDAVLHEGLARVLIATGRPRAALVAATAALRLDNTNSGALAVRAASLDTLDDRDGLLAALRQTVQMHPRDVYCLLELSALEAERGNLSRAQALVARAHRLRPADQEVANARLLLESVHHSPLLRPLPRLLAWLREFPGGLAGFLLGLLVATLPLHALTQAAPAYSIPVWFVLGAWAVVAAYAWIAPPILGRRIAQAAAAGGSEDFYQALAGTDPAALDAEGVLDLVHTQLCAHDRRAALETLRVAAASSQPAMADALLIIARRLDSRRRRAASVLLRIPGLARILVAFAGMLVVTGPAFANATGVQSGYGAAISMLVLALATMLVERSQDRVLEDVSIDPHDEPAGEVVLRDEVA